MSARRIRVGTSGWAVPRSIAGEFGAEGSDPKRSRLQSCKSSPRPAYT
jgi:hypothetical protein